jgi:nucleotide-binding universal stress UspA family protein
MIKNILVCTDGSAYGDVAREYGLHLAGRLQARLEGLHVLDSRTLEGPLMADISGWVGAQPFSLQLQQFRTLLQQKGETILQAFASRCAAEGLTAETTLRMGHPARVLLEEEARTELLVLGQKGEHAEWLGDSIGSTVDRVARHSLKPCLVTPGAFRPIQKILAAFDGSGHASQALHEAAELAATLNVPLGVLTVAADKDTEQANRISREGLLMAQAHQGHVTHLVGRGQPDAVILAMAAEYGYDLIVAGAHGHSRMREMILGSTTHLLIAKTDRPVMVVR